MGFAAYAFSSPKVTRDFSPARNSTVRISWAEMMLSTQDFIMITPLYSTSTGFGAAAISFLRQSRQIC